MEKVVTLRFRNLLTDSGGSRIDDLGRDVRAMFHDPKDEGFVAEREVGLPEEPLFHLLSRV